MTQKLRCRAFFPRWFAALAGMGLVASGPAAAQSPPPPAAPAEWIAYGEHATATIAGWLHTEEEAAQRLRAYLDQMRPASEQPGPPLVLKVWVDSEGAVSRVDFTLFAHAEPNANLRALMVGRRLAGPPPKDMLLPLRLAVQVMPPQPGSDTGRTPPPGSLSRFI